MTWFRVDDELLDNPKVEALHEALVDQENVLHAAMHIWLVAGVHSARNLLDGKVREAKLRQLSQASAKVFASAVDALVSAGLMRRDAGSVELHDWSQWNPTREQVEFRRNKDAVRKESKRTAHVVREDSARTPSGHDDASERNPRLPDPDPDPDPIERETPQAAPPKRQRKSPATALPADWQLTPDLVVWGETSAAVRLDRDVIAAEADKFRDHHGAKGSRFSDWDAAFRTWLRNARKFDPSLPEPRRRPRNEVAPLPQVSAESQERAERLLRAAGGDKMRALEMALDEAVGA